MPGCRGSAVLIPTNANGKCSLVPVSTLDDGHFTAEIRAWAVQDLVSMAMVTTWVGVTHVSMVV